MTTKNDNQAGERTHELAGCCAMGLCGPEAAKAVRAVRAVMKQRELEEPESNARLIAAAPELLKACQEALDALEGSKYGTDTRLAAAIAKAGGRQS